MRKSLILAATIAVSLYNAAHAAEDGGSITVFDPDKDIKPRLVPHDSTSNDGPNDLLPTTDTRQDGGQATPPLAPTDSSNLKNVAPSASRPAYPSSKSSDE